jgi:hypothetical protein
MSGINDLNTPAELSLREYAEICGEQSHPRWWCDLETGEPIERNHGELFMLMVSEISEAMEADRTGAMDQHLTHRPGVEVELADLFIRLMDMVHHWDIDFETIVREKIRYNAVRSDHQREARLGESGKRY